MGMLLKGKPVADSIRKEISEEIRQIREKHPDKMPKLVILRAGKRPDDIAYENMLVKSCTALGIEPETVQTDPNIGTQAFIEILEHYNEDDDVSGILIFRPMPETIDEKEVAKAIHPDKDVDCMNPISMAKVFVGEEDAVPPSTPAAVIELIKHYMEDRHTGLSGKHAAIINRSVVLGKALSMLFLSENATVTVCHSKTRNIEEITSAADIVVTGVGRAKFFDPHYFTDKNMIVDVGINFDEDGNMCGDVDTDAVEPVVRGISPVPGGVGAVTTAVLLRHVLRCYRKINKRINR